MEFRVVCLLGVLIFSVVSLAEKCGDGGAQYFYSEHQCCTTNPVSRYEWSLNGGHHASNYIAHIHLAHSKNAKIDDSTCEVYNSGSRCQGDSCHQSNDNHCSGSGTLDPPERICMYLDCENWVDGCTADDVVLRVWEGT